MVVKSWASRWNTSWFAPSSTNKRAFATRSASTFVRSQRNGSIEAKRKRLCKILTIAHAHIGAYALRGGKRKRFLHNERHAERAGVIIAVATRNKRECGALLAWNSL